MIRLTEKFWYELRQVDKVLGVNEKWLMKRTVLWFLFIPIYINTEIIHR